MSVPPAVAGGSSPLEYTPATAGDIDFGRAHRQIATGQGLANYFRSILHRFCMKIIQESGRLSVRVEPGLYPLRLESVNFKGLDLFFAVVLN
jgi:hypothetical protein